MAEDTAKYLDPRVLGKIEKLELRARLVVEGFVSGMHRSPYRGYSVEFAQHREYVPGDDIRFLDWKVYGRADRLVLKRYPKSGESSEAHNRLESYGVALTGGEAEAED